MGIYRSTNPLDWNAVDGIIIDEVAPPPSIGGVPANIAILVGQFERGDVAMQEVGSVGELYQLYGNNTLFTGHQALLNKRFGSLKVIRVVAAAAAAATLACNYTTTAQITFNALWKGAYGNSITVTIAAGTTQGSKYTVHDGNAGAVFPDEIYDNVLITAVGTTFANSKLISVVVNSTAHEPATQAATALASGSDGSVANTDYQTSIGLSEVEASGNVLFLDTYNATRNGYLKTSMANTTDKMTILCGAAGDSVATAVADVPTYRDVDGRIIYAFPYVWTTIAGVSTRVPAASFYAAALSQMAPNIDPAWAGNSQYFAGIDKIDLTLNRANYVSLMAAGISAFEVDSDIGIKIKSGVVTQISNSSKVMIFRRRMADYITMSVAKFAKNYQNAVNSLPNRIAFAGAVTSFNRNMENTGLVPKDAEVTGGKASIIDAKTLNTNDSIAAGFFKLLYRRRIYSSMRYIVIQAEIGESVVVTDIS